MDVVDLRDYYATSLGEMSRRCIRQHMRAMWRDVSGMNVLGIGYSTPFLGLFRGEAQRTIAAMPARQGVLHWPPEGPGLTALCDEDVLPFPDMSMDRVILSHALECAEHVRPLLREAWRVLADGGRLMVIVPNRRGIWAQLERTPFGHGQPYSTSQLSFLLRENLFTPTRTERALFVPPTHSRMLLSSAPAWEKVGTRFFPVFSGIIIMEAAKSIYAGQPVAESQREGRFVSIARERPHPTTRTLHKDS